MKFRDLNKQYQVLKKEIDTQVLKVMNECNFILGKQVTELEEKLAAYSGMKHCITCANGTDALMLALMALGIGKGDAVFTSDFTFIASAGSASVVGATAIPVDIDLSTFNISPKALQETILKVIEKGELRPAAIIAVDLFGLPANYPEITAIAKRYGIPVIEDAAQGFGGSIDGHRACSLGDIATTSFFPSKPLGCYGDGGAIFTNDDHMDVLLRSLRSQGRSPDDKYDNYLFGINSRLDTIQAAILQAKLIAFTSYELDAVNRIALWYGKRLQDYVVTPIVPDSYYSSWAQYSILLNDREQRDGLKDTLTKASIPSMIYYPRGIHQQRSYLSRNFQDVEFCNTVQATQRILSIPMHPYLTESEVEQVCDYVIQYLAMVRKH